MATDLEISPNTFLCPEAIIVDKITLNFRSLSLTYSIRLESSRARD